MKRRARSDLSPTMRAVYNLVGGLGVCIVLISLMFLVMFVGELIWGSDTERSVLLGLVVFFCGSAAAGFVLARSCFRNPAAVPVPTEFEREQRILDRAKAAGGRVTIPEIAADCDLSLQDSKQLLDEFVLEGAAEMLVTDDGILVYRFAGFLSSEKKARASDL